MPNFWLCFCSNIFCQRLLFKLCIQVWPCRFVLRPQQSFPKTYLGYTFSNITLLSCKIVNIISTYCFLKILHNNSFWSFRCDETNDPNRLHFFCQHLSNFNDVILDHMCSHFRLFGLFANEFSNFQISIFVLIKNWDR